MRTWMPRLVFLAMVLCAAPVSAVRAIEMFATPEAAMKAFGDAVAFSDEASLQAMLGDQFRRVIPPIEAEDRRRFLSAWAQSHSIVENTGKSARIAVGTDGWTLAIPIVKGDSGWRFDTRAGVEEMRVRQLGRNELAVMQTLLAIYDAQREYASADRDGDPLRRYAARLRSSPGKHDGLYWPTQPGEEPSPIGWALAAAAQSAKESPDGYHGYRYKLLTRQGTHAPGGALDYLVRGKLVGGFGVMAWPARYGDTGVMSFIINHDGQIYEQDLGRDGAKKAAAARSYDPGPGWRRVNP